MKRPISSGFVVVALLVAIVGCAPDDPFVLSTDGAPSVILAVDHGSAIDLTGYSPADSSPILLGDALADTDLVDLTALIYDQPLSSLGLGAGPIVASPNESGDPLPEAFRILRAPIREGEVEDWTEIALPQKIAALRRPAVTKCPTGARIEPIVLSPNGTLHWFAKVGTGLLAFGADRRVFEYTIDRRTLEGEMLDQQLPLDVITAGVGEALLMMAGVGGEVWSGSVNTSAVNMQPLPPTTSRETIVALDLWYGNRDVAYVLTSSGSFEYFDGTSWTSPVALALASPLERPGVSRGVSSGDSVWLFSRSDAQVGFFQRGEITYADTGATDGITALEVLSGTVHVGSGSGQLFRQASNLSFERLDHDSRGAPIVHLEELEDGRVMYFDEDGGLGVFDPDEGTFCTPITTDLAIELTKVRNVARTSDGLFVGGVSRRPNGVVVYRVILEEN